MFKIVSSSAGSGKTYTLTKEYLKLVLKNDNSFYFKHILAITFTKAATREMKERILGRLESFANPARTDPMLHDIIGELHPETLHDLEGAYRIREQEIRQRAARIFRQILHSYSDFAIMTIDSFVQRIVSAFTDELELPYSFEVEMEAQEILLTAVERMLEKAGNEAYEEITDVLEDFYLSTIQEGQNYHTLPTALASFAADLLQETKYAAIKQNANLTTYDIKQIRHQMIEAMRKWEENVMAIAQKGLETLSDYDLFEEDFSAGTAYKYFKKRSQADKAFETLNKTEYKVFEENSGWTRKNERAFLVEKVQRVKPLLINLYQQIEAIKAEKAQLYCLYQQLLPYLHNLSLLNAIKKEFDEYLRENNRVHISEFNQKILKIVAEDPVPFIYERLGEKFNHILIDEFQDTSKLQFSNLLPLIDNSLGYEHFNLAVGDSKQAIYRFRGGDMDQIIALHTQELDPLYQALGGQELTAERLENIGRHLQADALSTNRRSAKEIVNFNNAFFQTIADNYAGEFPLSKKVFTENFQQLVAPNAPVGGQVSIEFLETSSTTDTDEEATPLMLERTLQIIQQAIAEGFELADISILCRFVRDAKSMANFLKENGYNIISEDSLSLRFSGAINLLTALMRVLIQPDNPLQKYEALYLFYRLILHRIPDATETIHIKNIVEAENSWSFWQYVSHLLAPPPPEADEDTPLLLDPYLLLQISTYELTEKLIRTFGLFDMPQERDYLFKFLDLILEYNSQRGAHLADFIEHWETKKDKISISAPSNPMAITVQTIHKSKGLEYPVVIVPYANWQFTPNATRDTLWVQLRPTEETFIPTDDEDEIEDINKVKFLRTGAVKLKSDLQQTPDDVAKQYAEEQERVFVENMNLLYVAFTRPTQRLYVLAKNQDFMKGGAQKRISYWLQQFMVMYPDFEYIATLPNTVIPSKYPLSSEAFYVDTIISADRSQQLRLRRLADRIFDVETFERKRDYAQKIQTALSYIRTHQDVGTALMRLQVEGLIEQNERQLIEQRLRQIMQNPALHSLFTPHNYSLNQREILTPSGDLYCPSRVIVEADKVLIVDYKTSDPTEADLQQLQRYIRLYKAMGYQQVEAKLYYIQQDEVVEV